VKPGLLAPASGLTVAIATLLVWFAAKSAPAPAAHAANADDDVMVKQGKKVYVHACAACHGRALQGQPLWQLTDEFTGQRAPAHDQTGHTWQHSDEDLFRMTKYGLPHMAGFDHKLGDADILAVLAFIKRSWPVGLRVSQALLNPGHAGMPPAALQTDWRLPLTTCRGSAAAQGL